MARNDFFFALDNLSFEQLGAFRYYSNQMSFGLKVSEGQASDLVELFKTIILIICNVFEDFVILYQRNYAAIKKSKYGPLP